MGIRLLKSDMELLATLADYRVLTTTQIAMLHFARKKTAQRRLVQLRRAGFLLEKKRELGRSLGRPENVYSLGEPAFELLQGCRLFREKASFEKVSVESIHCLDHEILLNWFRLHLLEIGRIYPGISVEFLAPPFTFIDKAMSGKGLFPIRIQDGSATRESVSLIPDGVFRLHVAEHDLSLLFFLEVDMGTESLTGSDDGAPNIQQKMRKYQRLILSGEYKMFERFWGCRFNGFRLLFLANDQKGMTDICRIPQQTQPSDFIWVTSQEPMFAQGLTDRIWARGGRLVSGPLESILNSNLACPSPLPDIAP